MNEGFDPVAGILATALDDILVGNASTIDTLLFKFQDELNGRFPGRAPKAAQAEAPKALASAHPIYFEDETSDGSGTIHEVAPGIWATNAHVYDSFPSPREPDPIVPKIGLHHRASLEAAYGPCVRVKDTDLHLFAIGGFEQVREWLAELPSFGEALGGTAPDYVYFNGFPYGVRTGSAEARVAEAAFEHEVGRPDCLWYRSWQHQTAGGMSGSPAFASSGELVPGTGLLKPALDQTPLGERPVGIVVARGSTWEAMTPEEDPHGPWPKRKRHWTVVQMYHRDMVLVAGDEG